MIKETNDFDSSCETTLHVLHPMNCVLYTWENAIGTLELNWSYGKGLSQKSDLIQVSKKAFLSFLKRFICTRAGIFFLKPDIT